MRFWITSELPTNRTELLHIRCKFWLGYNFVGAWSVVQIHSPRTNFIRIYAFAVQACPSVFVEGPTIVCATPVMTDTAAYRVFNRDNCETREEGAGRFARG